MVAPSLEASLINKPHTDLSQRHGVHVQRWCRHTILLHVQETKCAVAVGQLLAAPMPHAQAVQSDCANWDSNAHQTRRLQQYLYIACIYLYINLFCYFIVFVFYVFCSYSYILYDIAFANTFANAFATKSTMTLATRSATTFAAARGRSEAHGAPRSFR